MFSGDRHVRVERVVLEHHRDVASFGGTSLTTSPPIMMSPSEMSSRPAIIRSVVDLPQPDGPDQHDKLMVGDVEIDAAHRLDLVISASPPCATSRQP